PGGSVPALVSERHAEVAPYHVEEPRRGIPWWLVGLLALGAVLAFGLSRLRHREQAPRGPATTSQLGPAAAVLSAGNVAALGHFLDSDAPVPKRFVLDDLRFATGSMELEPDSRQLLDDVASALAAHPTARIRVEGHTDS